MKNMLIPATHPSKFHIVMSAANTHFFLFLFFSHILLYFPLFSSMSYILSDHGPWISITFQTPTQPPYPLIISARASNISLTYSFINISHSESLSEPIRLMSEDLRASGGKVPGVWCQTRQLKPTPPICFGS